MPKDIPPTPGRIPTPTDDAIAAAVYPILIAIAGAQPARTITFVNLVLDARQLLAGHEHPIHTQIATSMGRRLEMLRAHTQAYGYPDLTSLVVNTGGRNPLSEVVARQAEARAFDWSTVEPNFLVGLGICLKTGAPLPHRSEEQARIVMAEHWRDHAKSYSPDMPRHRKAIIKALMLGNDPADVFAALDRWLRGPDGAAPA